MTKPSLISSQTKDLQNIFKHQLFEGFSPWIQEKDDAKRMLKENIFKYGIGIISIAIFKRHIEINPEAAEENVKLTTEAISPIFIGLVKTLSSMDI
jgi:hypothetical protein